VQAQVFLVVHKHLFRSA